jgi:hypothetical protein
MVRIKVRCTSYMEKGQRAFRFTPRTTAAIVYRTSQYVPAGTGGGPCAEGFTSQGGVPKFGLLHSQFQIAFTSPVPTAQAAFPFRANESWRTSALVSAHEPRRSQGAQLRHQCVRWEVYLTFEIADHTVLLICIGAEVCGTRHPT